MPKNFEFGESTKSYSAILKFYENETVFDMRPANKKNFKSKSWKIYKSKQAHVQDH